MFKIVLADDDSRFVAQFKKITEWEKYKMEVVAVFDNGDDVTKYKADSIEMAEIYGDFDTLKHYCELTTQGELFLDDKYVIGEICYLKNGYALAKSGVLYIYDKMTNSFMKSMSNVYVNDEWK